MAKKYWRVLAAFGLWALATFIAFQAYSFNWPYIFISIGLAVIWPKYTKETDNAQR